MTTKTIRSRFAHEIGEACEGCQILEKRIVIPPEPNERRLGVYEYVVEVPPTAIKGSKPSRKAAPASERGTFTRATPDEMGSVIRRLPSR